MEPNSVGFLLQIGTDPTLWSLSNTTPAAVAEQLKRATGPVALSVFDPLQGQIVVSSRSAGEVFLGGIGGSHPTGGPEITRPVVYLPSMTGASQSSPGYPLEPSTDLSELQRQITDAMAQGTRLIVRLPDGEFLVLDGASLAFAVLAQVAAKAGRP